MKKKIQIVHYIRSFKFGGIERLVYDLVVCQLESHFIAPTIAVLNKNGEFSESFRNLRIPILSVQSSSSNRFNISKIRNLYYEFKQCDIIHLHNFHIYITLIAILSRKKIVYTEHGNFAFGRMKTGSDIINQFLRKCFYKYGFHSIVCNSFFTKHYLETSWNFNSLKTCVIHNGINIHFNENEMEIMRIQNDHRNKFIIVTASRLAGFKRIDRLIEGFKIFHNKYKHSVLLIVGEGPERDYLEKISENELYQSIKFLGYKTNPQDYFSVANVCVFPSQREPFGLVCVEAYKAKSRVVVFEDGGGLTEIVARFNSNDIVKNVSELVSKLSVLYHEDKVKQDTEELLKYFSVNRMEVEYLNLYKRLLCVE